MLYICQVPHRLPATVWTASDEAEVISYLRADKNNEFSSAYEAAAYDHRAAYITADPLDLYHWICTSPNVGGSQAEAAFFRSHTIKRDIEDCANREIDPLDPEEVIYTAFDGFIWRPQDNEWSLGNSEPQEARSLVEALCEASLTMLLTSDKVEEIDV